MNLTPTLAAVALLVTSLCAQDNRTGYDSGTSAYTSRHGVPAGRDADVLHRVFAATLVGVGTAANATISGVRFVVQDQDRATPESFTAVFYPADASGAPGLGAATRSGEIALPGGRGAGAAVVSLSFATPVAVPATDYFYGVGLRANPTWPSDGLSLPGADYTDPGSGRPGPAAPGVVFAVDASAGALAFAALRRVVRMDLLTEGAALKAGVDLAGIGPVFGIAGHYHVRARDDGVVFELRDAARAGRSYAVLGQIFGAATPVSLGFLQGELFLNPALFFPTLLGSGTLDAGGVATVRALPAPLGLPAAYGLLSAQAVTDVLQVDGRPRLSNLVVWQDG